MGKILILSDPQADFLSFMTHKGFCEVYGGENVITYPYKLSHHGIIDDKYILPDGKRGMTAPADYMEVLPGRPWDVKEIEDSIRNGEIEFAIIAAPREYALNATEKFKPLLDEYNVPLVFIDGEDGTNIRHDIIRKFNPVVSFKRELTIDNWNSDVQPLPFSCFIDRDKYPDKEEKDIDVFFSVGATHPRRRQVVETLRKLPDCYSIFVATDDDNNSGRPSHQKYLDYMSRAKINVICRGHGWDTVRRFEACAFSGAMFSDRLPIITPDDFSEGESIVYYNDDISNLNDKIIYYLENSRLRRAVGYAGMNHAFKYHTTEQRAKYIISKIKETRR